MANDGFVLAERHDGQIRQGRVHQIARSRDLYLVAAVSLNMLEAIIAVGICQGIVAGVAEDLDLDIL